jgi:hypothetical protein
MSQEVQKNGRFNFKKRTMRATRSQSMFCAALQRAAAKANRPKADNRDILRPNASERAPKMGVVAVRAIMNPVPHQKALSLGASRAKVIAGRAEPRTTALSELIKGTRNRDANAK